MLQLGNSPAHSKEVEIESRRNNTIAHVLKSVFTGSLGLCENIEEFKDFVCRKFGVKLSCLLWDSRVVIPLKLREKIMVMLSLEQKYYRPFLVWNENL